MAVQPSQVLFPLSNYNHPMPKLSFRTWLGLFLALLSLVALSWSFWPLGRAQEALNLQGPLPGRFLRIDIPQALWVGQTGRLGLTLEAEGTLNTPAPGAPNYVVEARLELAGVSVMPHDSISEPLQADKNIHFQWSLQPTGPGTHTGTLWVYLNTIPQVGGSAGRQALLAMPVKIEEARSPFGLPVRLIRWTGGVSLMLGLLLFSLSRKRK